jgi:hypothetical protein
LERALRFVSVKQPQERCLLASTGKGAGPMDRIRIPLAGFLSLVLSLFAVGVLSQGAAASSPTYGVTANGGFISLGLLGSAVVTGAGSAADATSGGPVDASGTGVCLTLAAASSPCPTTATSTLSGGDLIDTTQRSTAHSVNSSGTAAPASACLAGPLALDALSLSAACGHASASEDASGNPTADGEGDLGNSAIDLTLDSIPGLSGVLGSGALCPSGSSSSASSAVPTAVVTTILGTVNQLLGTVDPSAPAIPAPSLSSPLPGAGRRDQRAARPGQRPERPDRLVAAGQHRAGPVDLDRHFLDQRQ